MRRSPRGDRRPIKLLVGEKDEFEAFHPERMAGRILGMGDVVSLVEKAVEAIEEDEAARMEEKLRKGEFSLEDFRANARHEKAGPPRTSWHAPGDVALKDADRQRPSRAAPWSPDLRHDP